MKGSYKWILCALCITIALGTLPNAFANTTYYADMQFVVQTDGTVVQSGSTNYPALAPGTSQNYTTKNKERWIVNITTPDALNEYVYTVVLPEGATVNYLHGTNARITTENGNVAIKGSGTNTALDIAVQYTVAEQQAKPWWYVIPLIAVALLVLMLTFVIRAQRMRAKREERAHQRHTHETQHNVAEKSRDTTSTEPAIKYIDGLPERQQQIIKLLNKAGGTLTQRQIELALKVPKSSVSRNVEALRRRGIIEKAQLGMTNTVILAEKYR